MLLNEEKIVLTGGGADLLFQSFKALFPPGQVTLDPDYKKGRARELLEMTRNGIVSYSEEIDSGPLYIRKSDAELSRLNK
jgi:tRNA threonylcarbamoyladenosine biosynthesis protein TsaB